MAHGLFQGSVICIKYTHAHTDTYTHMYACIFTAPCDYKCLLMIWAHRSESCFGCPAWQHGFPDIWHIPSSFSDIHELFPNNGTQQLLQTRQTGILFVWFCEISHQSCSEEMISTCSSSSAAPSSDGHPLQVYRRLHPRAPLWSLPGQSQDRNPGHLHFLKKYQETYSTCKF